MIVCVGASASGKTELAKILYKSYGYQKCVTTTTRNKRIGEKNGVDYHFVSEKEFAQLEGNDAFFEVSSYHGHSYGIQKKDVKKQGLVIVEPKGANTLISKLGQNIFVVYVKTSEKTREERMRLRNDPPQIIKERLLNDRKAFNEESLHRIDLIITNEMETLVELAEFVDLKYRAYLKSHEATH